MKIVAHKFNGQSSVGVGFKPPKYLVAGDVVRVEIDGIGALENPLR